MVGNLLRNSLTEKNSRLDGETAEGSLDRKTNGMSLSARLILLLTIAVGIVMALAGYFILRSANKFLPAR